MKKIIRKEILTRRKALDVDVINTKSRLISKKVIEHAQYQKADMLLAYIDAKGEVNTKVIIEDAWEKGKTVAVPKVHGEIMEFYIITSFDDLEKGNFGIMEPKETCEKVDTDSLDTIVIMPGVAFDRAGNRIGYGKGYYDKYFSKYPAVYKIALAFEMQIVPQIVSDEYDIKADVVVTEK